MTDDYTPTDNDLRDAYLRDARMRNRWGEWDYSDDEKHGAEFVRALAEHDREVAAKAARVSSQAVIDWIDTQTMGRAELAPLRVEIVRQARAQFVQEPADAHPEGVPRG